MTHKELNWKSQVEKKRADLDFKYIKLYCKISCRSELYTISSNSVSKIKYKFFFMNSRCPMVRPK